MKSTQKYLTKKTKDICEKLAIQCLEEMDFVLDGLSVLKRYILLVHKNLGIYKMSALSELVHVFNRVLDMAEENNEFHTNVECVYTKWKGDDEKTVKNWKNADYATIYVTVKHYEKENKKAFDEILELTIDLIRSSIDPEEYEEGDVERWRIETIIDSEGNEIKEKMVDDEEDSGLIPNEEEDESMMYETTFHYGFYKHDWVTKD